MNIVINELCCLLTHRSIYPDCMDYYGVHNMILFCKECCNRVILSEIKNFSPIKLKISAAGVAVEEEEGIIDCK